MLTRRKLLTTAASSVTGAILAGCTADTMASAEFERLLISALVPLRRNKPPIDDNIKPVASPQDTSMMAEPISVPNTASLEVTIGQMIMVGFQGLSVDENSPIVRAIRELHIGNVVLFDQDVKHGLGQRNIQSADQVRILTQSLQSVATIPMLIATDQEGGFVNRLKEQYGFAPSFSAQALGQRNDLVFTEQQADLTARQLNDIGINLNLAPVVDLNINPDSPAIGQVERSYSADPGLVTEHARKIVRAHRNHSVLCTLKHFPGHGSARADTHFDFTDVTQTWSDLELLPYAALIQSSDCDVVMTAHIFNANLDKEYPATLSHDIITGILRERLGFGGVVISDDMQMKAISDQYTFEKAIELAVLAGVDIIAIANNTSSPNDRTTRAVNTLRKLVDQGILSPERIDQSYHRIMALKARINS